jgi:hypothetical protein
MKIVRDDNVIFYVCASWKLKKNLYNFSITYFFDTVVETENILSLRTDYTTALKKSMVEL